MVLVTTIKNSKEYADIQALHNIQEEESQYWEASHQTRTTKQVTIHNDGVEHDLPHRSGLAVGRVDTALSFSVFLPAPH